MIIFILFQQPGLMVTVLILSQMWQVMMTIVPEFYWEIIVNDHFYLLYSNEPYVTEEWGLTLMLSVK